MNMNIAIIGAGFTGLTAANSLILKGNTVEIFEMDKTPGGLAMGFKKNNWDWSLEKHYHHIFKSDSSILSLAKEIDTSFNFYRPNTSSLIDNHIIQLDSPEKLLQFSALSVPSRLRMGLVLGYLKYVVKWQDLEGFKAHDWLEKQLGREPYSILWEPLLKSKFGPYYKDISLAWFWARIKARSTKLGYPEGGFGHFADRLAEKAVSLGGKIHFDCQVDRIVPNGKTVTVFYKGKKSDFDAVIVTVSNALFAHLAQSLPEDYKKKLNEFKGIGALNIVLELKKEFLPKDVYWLNICDPSFPFLAVVEHTHFIDKSHYNNSNIVYIGNYLPSDHELFSLSKEKLLDRYHPYLDKIHSGYKNNLLDIHLFKVPFAQPIVTTSFSKKILPFNTPIPNLYLANMQQVYPWDRGTNYAVEMGRRIAKIIHT
ncbi:oxidoreductase [Candidatus Roizmanbacteria bacterium CG11_big_fil_rev_8_21_14_0_20_36_8]|uniref:Oxidoreductase n=2 Tax=Candidatus Roizmaniibacteriota TaxID=1752723 RepID=A0A2M6IUD1_9BACT|nr:MAG: oxidoreductase [Candidatus Roizmanbacteria bacterium CG11_big_fil_rev_8_21_14_0_20_36_8]PIZ65491.1 MAG: oxidoreductase [Candidatus Roizmanbacteria bacterium CG_4_10_14_0_2_um_filter_36_9]